MKWHHATCSRPRIIRFRYLTRRVIGQRASVRKLPKRAKFGPLLPCAMLVLLARRRARHVTERNPFTRADLFAGPACHNSPGALRLCAQRYTIVTAGGVELDYSCHRVGTGAYHCGVGEFLVGTLGSNESCGIALDCAASMGGRVAAGIDQCAAERRIRSSTRDTCRTHVGACLTIRSVIIFLRRNLLERSDFR